MNQQIELNRFVIQIKKVELLFQRLSVTDDAAVLLYEAGARTPFFMMESLLRIYRKVFPTSDLEQWYLEFKALEDGLGKIDYFDFCIQQFGAIKKMPKEHLAYFAQQKEIACSELNIELHKKNWLPDHKSKLDELKRDLAALNFKDTDNEVLEIVVDELQKLKEFAEKEIKYTDVELSTHELRRKMRWISIYCQSFNGLFQLRDHAKSKIKLKSFLTKEVLASPFNQFPKPIKNACAVEYKNNYFFALSWMINELGVLKDKGLLVIALSEAIHNTRLVSERKAFDEACRLLNEKENVLVIILEKTEKISEQFSTFKIAGKLKKDIVKVIA